MDALYKAMEERLASKSAADVVGAPHARADGQFMQPAISIVVPSYNQPPEFVSECLASIFTQQGASFETIFVDGQSNPQTLAAAEPFRSRCAHLFPSRTKGRRTQSIRVCVSRAAASFLVEHR